MSREIHADFEDFFEKPSRNKLQGILAKSFGEFDHIDYKTNWPEHSSISRHVLALSNSKGGVLVVGVRQEDSGALVAEGLEKLKDKADIKSGMRRYLPEGLRFDVLDFSFGTEMGEGKRLFQVLFVDDLPEKIPFICKSDGKETRKSAIYVRDGTSSEEATYEKLQRIISRRIETQHSASVSLSLDEHLDQLERLYQRIPLFVDPGDIMLGMELPRNPSHPRETYEDYIARLIEIKKEIIDGLAFKQ